MHRYFQRLQFPAERRKYSIGFTLRIFKSRSASPTWFFNKLVLGSASFPSSLKRDFGLRGSKLEYAFGDFCFVGPATSSSTVGLMHPNRNPNSSSRSTILVLTFDCRYRGMIRARGLLRKSSSASFCVLGLSPFLLNRSPTVSFSLLRCSSSYLLLLLLRHFLRSLRPSVFTRSGRGGE